jgi:glycosyltransferase involved in cell wall biosynthesis
MSVTRILQVASGDLWGGAEACVLQLCIELKEANLDVFAVIMNPGELSNRLAAAGIRILVLDEGVQSPLALFWRLRDMLREFRPDVVHCHRRKENVLAVMASLAVAGPRPVLVTTIHGMNEHGPAPPWTRSGMARLVEKATDRFFDARVAVSRDLAGRLKDQGGGAGVLTIHNGIAAGKANPMRPPPNRTHPVVGFAGRLVPVKRVDLVLRVAQQLKSAGTPVRFEILGDGPLRSTLEAAADSRGLKDVVHFRGFRADVLEHLRNWDALVLTSDHEGMPMICLEALAAGVPIVARAVGGLGEIITDPEQGVLVDSEDPAALAAGVLSVIGRRAPAESGVSLLPAGFSSQEMCRRYVSLYNELKLRRADDQPG